VIAAGLALTVVAFGVWLWTRRSAARAAVAVPAPADSAS
jgi:hypothetical protein